MRIGDIIVCWDERYISIDKIVDIDCGEFFTAYQIFKTYEYDWSDYSRVPAFCEKCKYEDFDISLIKGGFYEKEYNKLVKKFFKKFKVDARKIKLEKLL